MDGRWEAKGGPGIIRRVPADNGGWWDQAWEAANCTHPQLLPTPVLFWLHLEEEHWLLRIDGWTCLIAHLAQSSSHVAHRIMHSVHHILHISGQLTFANCKQIAFSNSWMYCCSHWWPSRMYKSGRKWDVIRFLAECTHYYTVDMSDMPSTIGMSYASVFYWHLPECAIRRECTKYV